MTKVRNTTVLVVPLWNEFSRGSFNYLDTLTKIAEIDYYFVNDGSSDTTGIELNRFKDLSNVEIINMEENTGKSSAIKTGLLRALQNENYEIAGFVDGDGAIPSSEVQRCLSLALYRIVEDNYDAFFTSRVALSGRKIDRKTHRHFIGRIIRTLIDVKHKQLPYDTQCGFKFFKVSRNFLEATSQKAHTKWFIDLELLLSLRKKIENFGVWEEPLQEWHDMNNSSITWKQYPRIISDLIQVLFRH